MVPTVCTGIGDGRLDKQRALFPGPEQKAEVRFRVVHLEQIGIVSIGEGCCCSIDILGPGTGLYI